MALLVCSSMVDLRVDGTTGGTEGNVRLSAREKEPYEGVGPADMKSNSNTARKVLPQKGSIALITSSKGADRSRAVQARQGRKDKGAASRAAGAQTARLTKDIKVRDQETTDRLHAKASLAAAMAVDKLLRKELTAREGLEALDIIWEDDVTEIDNSKLCYTTEGCRR